jgi:hypothetical protein
MRAATLVRLALIPAAALALVAFKGFADTLSETPSDCGSTWTAGGGSSSGPPGTVPSYMAVLMSSSITKSGPTIAGNVPSIVVVKTGPGYRPNPGRAGVGTVEATLC